MSSVAIADNKSDVKTIIRVVEDRDKMFKSKLDRIIDKNTDYFNHLSGHCICGYCTCGNHKCPPRNLRLDFKKGGKSTYQQDYIPHKCTHYAGLKPDFWKTFNMKQPFDAKTLYNTEYTKPKIDQNDLKKDGHKLGDVYIPFSGSTCYKNDFLNWGANNSASLKPGYQNTVIKDLPFIGKTVYQEFFTGVQGEKDPNEMKFASRYGTFRSPMNPDLPFLGRTTYNQAFRPFKTGVNTSIKKPQAPEMSKSYAGQWKSLYGKDYTGKAPKKCQAGEILDGLRQEIMKEGTLRSRK